MNDTLINLIYDDINTLRNGQIYEITKKPGKPKCSTLADSMEDKFDEFLNEYEKEKKENVFSNTDTFQMLFDLLNAVSKEISELSKKQPDATINAFKTMQINRILSPLLEILKDEPSIGFLDIIAEPNPESKSRYSYSDVIVILSQFKEACQMFWNKNHSETDFFSGV